MAVNVASLYKKNSIQTASQADLILMLYEGAIKFDNIALIGFEKGDMARINTNIIKSQRIIRELRTNLDFKYPVAKQFDVMYDFIYRQLIEANVRKDPKALQTALKYTKEMRDTWKEVMRLNNK